MQHQSHWSTGPELCYHSGYQLQSHREFDSGHWQSPVEPEKPFWTELPPPIYGASTYPELPGPVLLSSGSPSFSPASVKQEYDSHPDCKWSNWSPTLTNSSLTSNTPSLPTLRSMPPAEDSAVRVDSMESPTYWLASDQFHYPTIPSSQDPSRRWHNTQAEIREDMHNPQSRRAEQRPRHSQNPEAEVQALLNRPRRVKTTAENAKFYCNECDKRFQRVYNLRSHMLKHEAARDKIPCPHAGCSKSFDRKTDLGRHERSVHLHLREHKCVLCGSFFARKDTLVRYANSAILPLYSVLTRMGNVDTSRAAAQNEREWIASDSKIRWPQHSWTELPTYADHNCS